MGIRLAELEFLFVQISTVVVDVQLWGNVSEPLKSRCCRLACAFGTAKPLRFGDGFYSIRRDGAAGARRRSD